MDRLKTYIRINDLCEFKRFITDARAAYHEAKAKGGGYSAFLHNDAGEVILQIEIAPKVRG